MVKIGNLFFRTRNFIFPIFYLFLFIPSSQLVVNYKIIAIIGISITIIGQLIRMVTIGLVYVIRGGRKRRIYAEIDSYRVSSIKRREMQFGLKMFK